MALRNKGTEESKGRFVTLPTEKRAAPRAFQNETGAPSEVRKSNEIIIEEASAKLRAQHARVFVPSTDLLPEGQTFMTVGKTLVQTLTKPCGYVVTYINSKESQEEHEKYMVHAKECSSCHYLINDWR